MAFGFGLGFPRAETPPLDAAVRALFPDVWYDPSDLTTLYQDAAGTTPVTAVEQAVGLMLDKSKGLVLGPELVTNGDFSQGSTGWSISAPGTNTVTISGGSVRFVTNGSADTARLSQPWSGATAVGKRFCVTFDVLPGSTGTLKIGTLGINDTIGEHAFAATPGFKSFMLISSSSGSIDFSRVSGASADATIDNISVRELPGYHAFHTPGDTTTRPTVSRRINQFTYTENFSNAAWIKTRTSITSNATTAPDGTLTGFKLVENTELGGHYIQQGPFSTTQSFVFTAWVKAGERTSVGIQEAAVYVYARFDLSNGTLVSGSGSIESAGSGWYKISATLTPTYGYLGLILYDGSGAANYAGDGTSGIYVWRTSLVPANLASLPYQRVNTATDYDTAEPFKPGESYDGVNDKMVAAAGGGATTAFFFCAGIQAKGVGSTQTLWSDTGTNTGYRVRINSSNQLELSAGNGSAYTTIATTATLAVGQRAVVTAWHDGTNLNVQIGSGAVASTSFATATAGTAGFSVGGDNGAASSFFRGWVYEAVYKKDSAMTAAQIATVQRFCAAKAGITL